MIKLTIIVNIFIVVALLVSCAVIWKVTDQYKAKKECENKCNEFIIDNFYEDQLIDSLLTPLPFNFSIDGGQNET